MHLSSERGLSRHTQENYARDLRVLFGKIGEVRLDALQTQDIRRVLAGLHAQGLSGKSLARTLSAWRGFYHYLAKRHGYSHNPCESLRAPKSPRSLPKALSPDQTRHLLEAPTGTPLQIRDLAILELFYSSGLRLSELAELKCAQLDLISGEVTVTGKGNKTRIVPVGNRAAQALARWLALRPAGTDYVFPGRAGAHLGQRAIELRLKLWAVRAGLEVNIHPHILRHSFASHLLQSSGDLRAVQEMLGHASISTTQIYTRLDFQHLAKVYDAAHPRARRKS
ncbi:tyrosine recombinase XerC [Sulfuriferula plumbiphila]|uniref:Tyrosine recombinase XerC n=2 Tax=Sulfuriferula plumbiphila TaxID=171865 RepID=A0A512L329_9PROT|nr:tyrosine recombinase XerC [Sulfuriferula plumbiphila]BBP02585.1 tyrosine recombinase XerC [Sulfuriferula plumbiphila]GEP28879.1 tyrosine recombinase XerC [Sulfuriferula plumbiphila]